MAVFRIVRGACTPDGDTLNWEVRGPPGPLSSRSPHSVSYLFCYLGGAEAFWAVHPPGPLLRLISLLISRKCGQHPCCSAPLAARAICIAPTRTTLNGPNTWRFGTRHRGALMPAERPSLTHTCKSLAPEDWRGGRAPACTVLRPCGAQVEAVVSQSDVMRLLLAHADELGGPFEQSLASLGLGMVRSARKATCAVAAARLPGCCLRHGCMLEHCSTLKDAHGTDCRVLKHTPRAHVSYMM